MAAWVAPLICDVDKEGGLTGGPKGASQSGPPRQPRSTTERLRMSKFSLVLSEARPGTYRASYLRAQLHTYILHDLQKSVALSLSGHLVR